MKKKDKDSGQELIDFFEKTLGIKETQEGGGDNFNLTDNLTQMNKSLPTTDILGWIQYFESIKASYFKKNNKDLQYFKVTVNDKKKKYKIEDALKELKKKAENKEIKNENEKLKKAKEENKNLKETNAELENLKKENEEIKKRLQEENKANEQLKEENKNLKENNKQLTKENKSLTKENEQLNKLKETNEELNKLKETNEQLQKELDEVKDKQKLNSEVNSKDKENINQLKEELNQLKENNKKLTKENKQLKETNAELQEQLENLTKENEQLKEQNGLLVELDNEDLDSNLNGLNIEQRENQKRKIKNINIIKDELLDVKYKNNNLILNKKREHKTGNFIKNAAQYYNLNGGAQMAIDKLMKDLENTKGDKKERDKIWQEFANNKSSHLYSKKSRLNELLKAFGTIKSAKHLFQQEDDRLEKKDENIDENSLQQEYEFLKIEDEKKKKNGKLVEQYKTILNMLSNNDALDKTYDGEFLWNSSIVEAIRPELEELQKRVLKDEKEKEEYNLPYQLGDLAIDINKFINKHSVPEIKDDEKNSKNEEASKGSEEKKENESNKSKELASKEKNNTKINKINVNNEKNSLDDKEEKKSKNSNSSNKEKQDFSQILSELEKKLDKLEKQIKNKQKKTENNKNNEMKKENKEENSKNNEVKNENKEENNKNDEVKGELEKIKNDEILKKIEEYKKQIDDLKKVAKRVEDKAKQNQSKGNNKEVNEGGEQKIIEDNKNEEDFKNAKEELEKKFKSVEPIRQIREDLYNHYENERDLEVINNYMMPNSCKKYLKDQTNKQIPIDLIKQIYNTDMKKLEDNWGKDLNKDNNKKLNNNFSEKSLYDISQDIINKLKNMDKGYGM